MTDERRASPRHTAHLAGELQAGEGNTAIAITKDVGKGGLLLYTRLREVTGTVKLTFVYNEETLVIEGTVLRTEPVEDSPLWRTKVALAVEDNPVLAKLSAALAAKTEADDKAGAKADESADDKAGDNAGDKAEAAQAAGSRELPQTD